MPFQKWNPNGSHPSRSNRPDLYRLIPKRRGSLGVNPLGKTNPSRVGKENRIGRAWAVPKHTDTAAVRNNQNRVQDEIQPEMIQPTEPSDHYKHKLTNLHDCPTEPITGTPLYAQKSPDSYMMETLLGGSFAGVEIPNHVHSKTPTFPDLSLLGSINLTNDNGANSPSPVGPPPTLRTSKGSSSFDLEDAGVESPSVETKPSYQFDIYLDSTVPPLSNAPTLDLNTPTLSLSAMSSREECVRKIRKCCDKPSTRKSADAATSILSNMIQYYNQGQESFCPDGACFNWCIRAYAQLGLPKEAEGILNMMFRSFQRGNETAEPNAHCFTSLLHAWRKSKSVEAPVRCERLLVVMNDLVDRHNLMNCKPDVLCISVVMQCWMESDRADATTQVERLFNSTNARFLDGDQLMRPDRICYSLLLSAYAKDLNVQKAESLVTSMIDSFVNGDSTIAPCTRNINTLLSMYARSGKAEAPLKAESLVARFRSLSNRSILKCKPDVYTYSQLLKCWTKSDRRDAVDQAITCFFWMRDLDEEAAAPDFIKYHTILSAMLKAGDGAQAADFLQFQLSECKDGVDCKPDLTLCESVIEKCATNCEDMIVRGELLLESIWALSGSGVLSFKPRLLTYKKLIRARISVGDAPGAFRLLQGLQTKNPPPRSSSLRELYRGVLNCCKLMDKASERDALAHQVRMIMKELFAYSK